MGRYKEKGMVSKAQKEASKKYNRSMMVSIAFRLHKETDKDLIAIYEAIPNKMEWFREALRKTGK